MAKQTITFFSNFTQHQLVRQPRNDKPVPSGVGWINETPGVRYQFMPAIDESGKLVGRLDVRVGQDVMQDTSGWLAPDEDQGIQRDAVDALRAHREYARDFWQAPVPATMVRSLIRQASVALSEEALLDLLKEERGSVTPRADLISEAEDALSLVREQVDSLRASQEAQEAEQAAPKAKAKPKAPAPA